MIRKLDEVPPPVGERVWRQDELPDEDGKPVETFRELPQSRLLCDVLEPVIRAAHPDGRFIIGSNSGIYWRFMTPALEGCLAPDWYYVPDVDPDPPGEVRRSYHFTTEHQSPRLLVEQVSGNGDVEHDMTAESGKMWVYEQVLHAEHYAIYDPFAVTLEVWAFDVPTGVFVPVLANARGHLPIAVMGVELGIWRGVFANRLDNWLRAWDANGVLLPTYAETSEAQRQRANNEQQRANNEEQRANNEERRANRLAERLRALGIDPDTGEPIAP